MFGASGGDAALGGGKDDGPLPAAALGSAPVVTTRLAVCRTRRTQPGSARYRIILYRILYTKSSTIFHVHTRARVAKRLYRSFARPVAPSVVPCTRLSVYYSQSQVGRRRLSI